MIDSNLPKLFRYISYVFFPGHIWELEAAHERLKAESEVLLDRFTRKHTQQEQELLDACSQIKLDYDQLKRDYEELTLQGQSTHLRAEAIHRVYCNLHHQVEEFIKSVDLTWDGFRPSRCQFRKGSEDQKNPDDDTQD
jgi:hypothetical protein